MEEILGFICGMLGCIVWFIICIVVMTLLALTSPLWIIPYIIYRKTEEQ